MGGEYLPHYLVGEVEIARICLQSTTSDVISLRARPSPEGICYRVIDEYEGQFTLPISTSLLPLTLAELIRQFDDGSLHELDWDGGLSLGYNNMNADGGSDYESLRHFTNISSSFYGRISGNPTPSTFPRFPELTAAATRSCRSKSSPRFHLWTHYDELPVTNKAPLPSSWG